MSSPMLPIVIIERTGSRRPVVFFDAMLPRSGGYTNFDLKQRTKVTRYAGNAQATGQVLGPEFEPIRFHGLLEDRRIGIPGAAVAAALWIKTIAKAGRECIFNYGPFFYRVLWKKANFTVVELQRIKYSIELEVLDDSLGQRRRVKRGSATVPSTTEATASVEEAGGLLSAVPTWMLAAAISGGVAATTAALNHLNDAHEELDRVGEGDSLNDRAAAKSALTSVENARSEVNAAANYTSQLEWRDGTSQGLSEAEVVSGPGVEVMQASAAVTAAGTKVLLLRDRVSVLAGNSEVGRTYIASQGETLQGIAKKFYGSAHKWTDIYKANGLTSPVLVGGENLILRNLGAPDPPPPPPAMAG